MRVDWCVSSSWFRIRILTHTHSRHRPKMQAGARVSLRSALHFVVNMRLHLAEGTGTGLLAPVSEHLVGGGWGEREVEQGVEEELGVEKVLLRE